MRRLTTLLLLLLLFLGKVTKLTAQDKILRFDHLTVEDGLSQNTVQGIVKDKYGFMWFGTWGGLCRFDGYKFVVYRADPDNPHALRNNRIQLVYKDANENIWVNSADTQVCRYNYLTDDFTRYYPPSSVPSYILDSLDRYKNMSFTYIKTKDYLYQVNQQNNLLTRRRSLNQIDNLFTQKYLPTGETYTYRSDPLNRWALNDEFVFDIYLDDNKILWVGTWSGGINRADTRQKCFNHYNHIYQNPNSIIDNQVRAIFDDNQGNLWVGTHNKGITKFNRRTNTFTHYQHNDKDTVNSLVNNQIRKIYRDKFGYMWFGTKGGIDRFDTRTNKFWHYKFTTKRKIMPNWIYWVMEDHWGTLWIATWAGIAKYNRKKDKFTVFDPLKTLKHSSVRVILEDKKYNLWVATEGGGITCLKRHLTNGFEERLDTVHYLHSDSNPNSLSSNRVYSMVIDEKGIFWIGTNWGLNRFDPETKVFKRFSMDDGFPDDLINGILCDQKGHLWVSHKKGLTRFDTRDYSVRNYGRNDGLQDDEFSEDAYFRNSKTGEMFFGGVKGFNSFFPDSIRDNKYLPKVYITDLLISNKSIGINQKVNGRVILTKPVYLTYEITLTHLEPNFTFEFAGLHYSNPYGNKYAYKLEGYESDWTYTNASKRQVSYSNLDARTYRFMVRAANNDGVWNPEPAVIIVRILPPIWKTWWFRLFVMIALLVIIYLLYHLREANFRRIQKELRVLVGERTRELEDTNKLLITRQSRIEEQSEELRVHSENLKETNDLLVEKQRVIQEQDAQLLQTNQQLSVLNSTKDRFFSIIAHDLRNPFHVVGGFSELLLRDLERLPKEKVVKYLQLIYTSSKSGNMLLENLLQWSRSQTGNISFEPCNLNLLEEVEDTINFVEGDTQRKNISIEPQIDKALLVFADENMIKTIFRNLISNAIKFSNEHGKIIIKATVLKKYVEISVIDNGIGISYEGKKMLFRNDTILTTKGTMQESGTGLGLILCKEFVEKHNGTIRVESEIEKGSAFIFTLPIVA